MPLPYPGYSKWVEARLCLSMPLAAGTMQSGIMHINQAPVIPGTIVLEPQGTLDGREKGKRVLFSASHRVLMRSIALL